MKYRTAAVYNESISTVICASAYRPVLRLRIRDPVPFLTPGSGMGKKSVSRSGMKKEPDHISDSLETIFG
jgi:hypothetical protein